jgi:DNA-binding beta-propeller fold protein YncE
MTRKLRLPLSLAMLAVVASGAAAPAASTAPAGTARQFVAVVALEEAGRVAVLRGPPWRLVRTVRVPAGPHNVVASPNGEYVAVTSPPGGAVTLLRTRTGAIARTVAVGGSPHDAVFGRDSRTLWVAAERAAQLVELAVPSGKRLRTRRTSGGPHDLDLDRGNRLWVTIDGSPRVEVRNAATGALLARPDLGGAPHDVAVSPNGRTVWFSNWSSGRLTAASTASRRPIARITAGTEPHHFVFGLERLWVTDNAGDALVRIDPRSGRILARTAIGSMPHHPAVAGRVVLVAVHGTDRVAIVNQAGRLLRTLDVGGGPHGIAAVAARPG